MDFTTNARNPRKNQTDATRFPLFIKGLLKLNATQNQLDTAAALMAPCRFDTDCNRSVQGTMNQMTSDIEHMRWFEEARLEDI